LIGGPDANAVTRKMIDKLPLRISSDKIIIDGKSFPATDAFVAMLYPNPANADRYVAVLASTSWQGLYLLQTDQINYVDFQIEDGRVASALRGQTTDHVNIASGAFDKNWRLDNSNLQTGDSEVRAQCVLRKVNDDLTIRYEGGVRVEATILDKYVGQYELQPNFIVTVRRDGEKLFMSATNRPEVEVVALSETEFIVPLANVTAVFVKEQAGRATAARFVGNNLETEAKKIK
jgi:hypothetical protein